MNIDNIAPHRIRFPKDGYPQTWWFDSVKKCNSHLDLQVDRKMASHVTPGILPCCMFLVDGLRSNPTPPWRAKPTATRPGAVWQTRWRKAPHHSSGSKPTLAKGQFSSLSRDSRWFVYWNSGFRRSICHCRYIILFPGHSFQSGYVLQGAVESAETGRLGWLSKSAEQIWTVKRKRASFFQGYWLTTLHELIPLRRGYTGIHNLSYLYGLLYRTPQSGQLNFTSTLFWNPTEYLKSQ